MLSISVHMRILDRCLTSPLEPIAHLAHALHLAKARFGDFGRLAHADNAGHIFRSAAFSFFQEKGKRGGTENVPGIVGMGKAAEIAKARLGEMQRVSQMRDRLEGGSKASVEDAHVNGDREHRLPNTTNIGFSRLEAEAILLLLSEQGICASAGAACSSGSLEPSHVLRAMKIDERIAHGAIRFSLSRYTTEAEIDRALDVLPGVVARLRAVLPVG